MRVNTDELKTELQWASRIICKKSTMPILANVLLEAEPDRLRLTATDLEHALITEIKAHNKEPWTVTIPAKMALKYLSKVEEGQIELSTADNKLHFAHGDGAGADIFGMSKESYPELPQISLKGKLSGLEAAIPRTALAVSSEESRFSLNGALLEASNGDSRFVSTDGHRMSLVPVTYHGEKTTALVRMRALIELAHLKTNGVDVGWNDDHLLFQYGNRKIISRKLTGNFPDYHRVMPVDFPHAILVGADALYKLVDRVKVFADERSHAIHLEIKDGRLNVKAEVCETGVASGHVPLLGGAPDPAVVGLNADYLLDFLALTKGQTVGFCYPDMETRKDGTSGIVKGMQFLAHDGWSYLVMPMRV